MKVKEFISNALTQIADGVQEAIGYSEGKGYLVNPSTKKTGETYTIHFDLCVEVEKEGEVNIKVAGGSLSETSTNRITFDVKMTLPASGERKPPTQPA